MKFTDLLRDRGVPLKAEGEHHHARAGWIQLDCPFCGRNSDKFHMGYNIQGGYTTCWSCGPHSLAEVTVHLFGITFKEAKTLLKDVEVDRKRVDSIKKRGTLKLPKNIGPLLGVHKKYLKGRGFKPKQLEKLWGIQGIGMSSKLGWRIFIPIHYQGEIVSWTTRSVTDKGLRYLSAGADEEAINHKDLLYGEDNAKHAVCCVEGPFDVWNIGPGAVGTCGTGYSRAQVLKLSKYPIRAVCFDNSKAAQKRANDLCDMLSVFPGETFNIELDADDPGCAGPEEIQGIRETLNL